jgi:predicted phage-related endonuclease
MGDDEGRLLRLWREKRGELESEDLSANLIVQLGTITEDLNRNWYERNTGFTVKDVQRRLRHNSRKQIKTTLSGSSYNRIRKPRHPHRTRQKS